MRALFNLTSCNGGYKSSGLSISVCLHIGKSGCLVFVLYSSCDLILWFANLVIAFVSMSSDGIIDPF